MRKTSWLALVAILAVMSLQRTHAQFLFGEEIQLSSSVPFLLFTESDQAANERVWRVRVNGKNLIFETANDALSATVPFLTAIRGTGTAVTTLVVQNAVLQLSGITSGSFADILRGSTWAVLGWPTATNTRVALGGYRSSQWTAVDLYANGNPAGTFTDAATTLPGAMVYSGVISPTTLCTGTPCTVDDWTPTGLAGTRTIRALCDLGIGETCTLTSIAGGVQGREFVLINIGGPTCLIDIADEAGTGTAANKILTGTGGTVSLAANQAVTLQYDKDIDRWRIVSRNF